MRLHELRAFSLEAECQLHAASTQVISSRTWTQVGEINKDGGAKLVCSGNHYGYFKPYDQLSDQDVGAYAYSEKFGSDLGHYLHIPIATGCFATIEDEFGYISMRPHPKAVTLHTAARLHELGDVPSDEYSTAFIHRLKTFFAARPQAAQAYAAICVFDNWVNEDDRHSGNIVIYPGSSSDGLYGIDIESMSPANRYHVPYHADVLRELDSAVVRPACLDVLAAIENCQPQKIIALQNRTLAALPGINRSAVNDKILKGTEQLIAKRNSLHKHLHSSLAMHL